MPQLGRIAFPVAVLLSIGAGAAAQAGGAPVSGSLSGAVVASEDGSPVAEALLVLTDTSGSEVARTISGRDGTFRIARLPVGRYLLGVHALGYESAVNRSVLVGDERLRVEVFLRPGPVALDPLIVSTEALSRKLEAVGYYRRAAVGIGRYIPPEEFERPGVQYVSDVLRIEPSIEIRPFLDGSNRWDVRFRSAFRQEDRCSPLIVVDGTRIRPGSPGGAVSLDELVHPANVLAVELYPRGVGQPVQWSGVDAGCGVIVVWTKTYRP